MGRADSDRTLSAEVVVPNMATPDLMACMLLQDGIRRNGQDQVTLRTRNGRVEIMLGGMASSQNSMVGQNGLKTRLSGIDCAKYINGDDPMVTNTRGAA